MITHSLQAEVKMTYGINMIKEESSASIIDFRRLETVKIFYKNYLIISKDDLLFLSKILLPQKKLIITKTSVT